MGVGEDLALLNADAEQVTGALDAIYEEIGVGPEEISGVGTNYPELEQLLGYYERLVIGNNAEFYELPQDQRDQLVKHARFAFLLGALSVHSGDGRD